MCAAEFVHRYFDAWNHKDPEAVAGHLAADGTYLDVPDNEQSSRDELIVDLHEFFADDYVNGYRIDRAKELLSELDGHSDSVLNIALSVGFNSNSAFYKAFRKAVGQAPARYRRWLLSQTH